MGRFTRTQGMGVAALALGISAFLSRILGLVRDKVISYYFGTGSEADVYFTAFVVPDFLNYLLAGGYFSITLVPLLAVAFKKDEEDGWRFFSAALAWAALSISLLTLAAWIFAPNLVAYAAPGFSPENLERLTVFLRIILPAQICFLPGACFSAVLYYRRQFTVPALAPLVYNGCIIIGGILWLHVFPEKGMEGFCWGVLAGAFCGSLLLPALAVRSGGMRLFPGNGPVLLHPGMKTVLFLALPLMLGQSLVALDEQFIRVFGSLTGEGGVSLLNYARRIMQVPVGVVAQAAGLATYPFLAALAAEKKYADFNASLNRAVSNTLLVALPLSLWMMAAGEPIMRLIFQQGRFTAEAAAQSGLLLSIMLASVTFWAMQQLIGRAFYAHQDTLTPALCGTATTLLTLPLYWYGARVWGAPGVALAGTVGVVLYTLTLCFIWLRRFGPEGLSGIAKKTALSLIFCLPAYAAAYGVNAALLRTFPETSLAGAFARICATGLVFGLLYLVSARLFAPDLCAPLAGFAGKIRKKLGK